ncbi:MAG: stage II sporulation protein P [Clostridia bacterium]|nr:stage II sporulation protein P [Clostridia bacterium]
MQKINLSAVLGKKVNFGVVFDLCAKAAILLLAVFIMVYSSFDRLFAFSPESKEPTLDELEAGAEELPPAFRDIIFEREYPLGLGIYDTIFADETVTVPKGELKISSTDLSKNPMPDQIYFKNKTAYDISISDFLTAYGASLEASKNEFDMSQPLVLIYHTHGTEGYAEEGKVSYSASNLPRSTDTSKNVVAVGKYLADILNANGIPTVHDETMHDNGSYNTAYTNSAKSVKEYLKKYPSIKYAFDIHRDALVGESVVYKTLTYDESTPTAQLMFVVGTDEAGAANKSWRRNLSFAVNAQHFLISRLNNIARPMSIRRSAYNQHYAPIGALIEVGTCVNTLAEAKAATEILGEVLSGMILSGVPLYGE